VWASGEADRLVAGGEINVKPGNECVDEIIAAGIKDERSSKSQVGGCAGVEVEGEDGGGVGNDGFNLDSVDEGLGKSGVLERGVVEAVNVVPD
jgi:hypothetical protein